MSGKLYDARRAANMPEAQAREAAEEVAACENRLSSIESEPRLIRWMAGVL